MSQIIRPKDYKTLLSRQQTELAIKQIKEFFSRTSPRSFVCVV